MTGFGRSSFEVGGTTFDVEARSVNSRHLDTRVKLPRQLGDHESLVKALVAARVSRGKVDVQVALASGAVGQGVLQVDHVLAGQYVAAARSLAAEHDLPHSLGTAALIAMPGVTRFVEPELPEAELEAALTRAVGSAVEGLVEMRCKEGEALLAEFETRLAEIGELVAFFEERAGLIVEATKERLRRRTEQIRVETGLGDEARLHQEIVIAADRLDVTEELVRLRSHVEQFRAITREAKPLHPVGRRLDFLLQELGREANTVGSKASDAPIAHAVVELKSALERLREQVQNVE